MAKNFKTKRIQYEDDIVLVLDREGRVIYKGLEDYEPNKREQWRWDDKLGGYRYLGMTKYCLDI